ncbi:BACON domain-containing protein [Alistipes communis]|uniref:BACON domain-containing protein n=1 Tax=Alistipes communis TaxID=2585118 RepID=UPI0039F5F613
MKRLYHVISGLAGGVLLLAGCEGDTIVLDADPVAPEATTLSVTSDNPLYSAQEGRRTLRFKTPGGEVVFSVETNAETWSYTNDNEAWLAVEQNEYDGTLTLRAQRNEEASEPAAEVVVTAGEGSGARTWTVEVVQNAAGTPEIVATPNRVLIPACGSLLSASTEIACNYEDWEFTQSCDWMLVERQQDKLVFTADENTSSESRQVEVKLTAGYGDRSISETVVVEQDGRAFVRALPEALSFDYRGGTKTIAVSSNFKWNHAADAKWFAVTRENDVLTVTVDPYDGENRGGRRTSA